MASIMQKGFWFAVLAVLTLAGCGGGGGSTPAPTLANITAQPADQSVVEGNTATFSVTASNAVNYQWQISTDGGATFTDIVGATAASYTTPTTTIADSGKQYRVVASRSSNSVTSSAATLTVTAAPIAPAITVQPSNQTVIENQNASFSVTATGTSLAYQWQRSTDSGVSFTDLTGETNATLTRTNVLLGNSGQQFRVVVSNGLGTVTSNAATLTVNPTPVVPAFTTQPTNQSVTAPATASFSVIATGTPAPTLQWQVSTDSGSTWNDIATETGGSYTTPATTVADSGKQYRAVATNSAGTTNSNAATLTVAAPVAPSFTTHPSNATVLMPATATFTVAASGVPTPNLQWELSTDNGVSWSNINGANAADYTTPATTADDDRRQYRAVATNSAGSANSNAAKLTITTPAAPDNWVTNGSVYAIARSEDGNTIYLGGQFTRVGPNTGSFAAIDTASGVASTTFPRVVGLVMASAPDGAGGWYIGGSFTLVGGIARNNLAHILADGSVDANFSPNPNSWVVTLAVSGSTVYAGGHFTSIGGQPRNRLASIDATTGALTAWDPNASNYVAAIAVSGTTVYVGGGFTSIGVGAGLVTRNRLAEIDTTTGLATAWDPNANNDVSALAVSGTTVYAGGYFTSIGAGAGLAARNYLAALDATTGTATAWDPNANAGITALAVSGSTVYAGGYFTSIGAGAGLVTRNRLAEIDTTTGLATAWDPNANSLITALAVSGSTVYAGGYFTSIGAGAGLAARNYLAAIDATTGLATAWDPNANNWVGTLAVSGSTVYAGGNFIMIGGQAHNNLAAVDASTGIPTAWNPNPTGGVGYFGTTVNSFIISGNTVYVGGCFTSIGGQTRNNLAAIDATTGAATAWDPNLTGGDVLGPGIYALAISGNTMYAGGDFTDVGGQLRNNLAAIDATTGLATAWDPNANSWVVTLALSGSTVYAGGYFTSISGQLRNNLAAIDATTGLATAWDPNANSGVYTLAVSGNTVYAGGQFTTIGGAPRNRIAALDAATNTNNALAWDPNANNDVFTLAVSGSTVYVGGMFTTIGGQVRNYLAGVDVATGIPTAWDAKANGQVGTLAVSGSTVYAGGNFTSIGGQVRNGIGFIAR